jgi:hypothetical protein
MNYSQLSSSYKYDTIAEAMYSREIEHFHYAFDAANFTHLLGTAEEGPYKQELHARLASTLEQMHKVDSIYSALEAQIEDPVLYAEAVERATLKRNAVK